MLTNAIYGNDCKDSSEIPANSNEVVCRKNWITMLSLGNKHDKKQLMYIQEILNLVTIGTVIVLL